MPKDWIKLDNAAKIFPPAMDNRDTKVFRFSCDLNETVDPEILQAALGKTLKLFPFYRSTLKRGFFWYYLEISALEPVVSEERNPPCSPIYDRINKALLFVVSFYKKRINLEVFHALSDGTGALQFIKTLVYQYLRLKYKLENVPGLDYDASFVQKIEDSFQKNYVSGRKLRYKGTRAYRLRGTYLSERRQEILLGRMSVKDVLKRAKAHGTTITIYLAAILMSAINAEMAVRHKKRPVVISVPVNLRNYFNSATARNFFGIIRISYNFGSSSGSFDDIVEQLKRQFSQELTTEQLSWRMHSLTSLERNIFARLIPLQIKNLALRIASAINKREYTCTFSNLGIVNMPEAMLPYIRGFDVFKSTGGINLCIISHGDRINMGFTSAFAGSEIQKRFFRFLANEGIEIEISSNITEDEEAGEEL